MSTQLLYLSQIRTELRGIVIQQVDTASGQYNDVVIINQEWIFRFPRFREDVARTQQEVRVLEALQGRLPLPIPNPEVKRLDPPVPGLAFTGYRRLPGVPLSRGALDAAQGPVRENIAGQLARFLRALHGIPLAELGELGPLMIEPKDGRADWERLYGEVREKLFPAMRPDARKDVSRHFEAYLDEPSLHHFDPCLRHGDFGGSNILWDPQQGAATAVLDFTFCALGDPALDLAAASTLGDEFFPSLLEVYAPLPLTRGALQARARFYRGVFALEEALDGLRLNDAEAYQAGMAQYF